MSRTVVPDILERLRPQLNAWIQEWDDQRVEPRQPTLPVTPDGKVNVRALVTILGLPQSNEQHFYRHDEIKAAVNAVARDQGVLPIGARADADGSGDVLSGRLKQALARADEMQRLVVEQAATIERQRRQIESYRAQLGLLEETGQAMRTGDVR